MDISIEHQYKSILAVVVALFESEMPKELCYHNFDHTLLVLENAEKIAQELCITNHKLYLLKIAALFHDTGFSKTRIGHEMVSCAIANRVLMKHGFCATDIQLVQGMILATKIPQQPTTLLEQILADADLLYLGTADFTRISRNLFLELKHEHHALDFTQWNKIQIDFLVQHHFFTSYAIANYESIKQFNLNNLYHSNNQVR